MPQRGVRAAAGSAFAVESGSGDVQRILCMRAGAHTSIRFQSRKRVHAIDDADWFRILCDRIVEE